MQTLTRRGVVDAAAGLGLHFLHMSEGPFSHDAGHIRLGQPDFLGARVPFPILTLKENLPAIQMRLNCGFNRQSFIFINKT